MQALRYTRFGAPQEVLALADVPIPEGAAEQVRIRMRLRPINPYELLTIAGRYATLPTLPAVAGMEGMGVIDAAGANVPALHTGTRVILIGVSGTWQEFVLAQPTQIIPVPDQITDEAAALVANPVSAWVLAVEELNLQPGEWVVQTAATSHFGRILIQLAKLRGFRTLNVVRHPAQVGELQALGADAVITADELDADTILRLTHGATLRAAIDAVGGDVGTRLLPLLQPGGIYVAFAGLSGQPIAVSSGLLTSRSIVVRGFWSAKWLRSAPPPLVQKVVTNVLGAMASGAIRPPVEAVYDLADFHDALTRNDTGGLKGKVLLRS